MDKISKNKTSKGAEEILLAQIKQEFTTPADAISDYLELVEKTLLEAQISMEDEVEQIKSGCKRLIDQYEEAFAENTGPNATTVKKTPEEYSELRHNLRTPLNAIIGYSEILMEDLEDDLSEESLKDLQSIIELSRETETAIENFVDYIRGEAIKTSDGDSQLESAESLFKSLGDINYSLELDESLEGADILIVDDNKTNCEVLERRLSMSGLTCRTSYDGKSALDEVEKQTPDLILLDWMLPKISGTEVCRQIRRNEDIKETPLIMLTARSEESDKVRGLDVGADDFVTKPYSVAELLARVKAAMRRPSASIISDKVSVGVISIDTKKHQVFIHNSEVVLGPTEYRLLMTFMKQPGRVYSRDQLLDMVWGISSDIDTRTVDVHVGRLRKIIDKAAGKKLIRTVRSFGYALNCE